MNSTWNGYKTKADWQDARRRATLQKSRKRSNLLERIYWPLNPLADCSLLRFGEGVAMNDPQVIRKPDGELTVLSKNEALKLLLLKGMELTDKPLDQFISKVLASRALAR